MFVIWNGGRVYEAGLWCMLGKTMGRKLRSLLKWIQALEMIKNRESKCWIRKKMLKGRTKYF